MKIPPFEAVLQPLRASFENLHLHKHVLWVQSSHHYCRKYFQVNLNSLPELGSNRVPLAGFLCMNRWQCSQLQCKMMMAVEGRMCRLRCQSSSQSRTQKILRFTFIKASIKMNWLFLCLFCLRNIKPGVI
jgi:hypothetical protein